MRLVRINHPTPKGENNMNKANWICTALAGLIVIALVVINAYVLEMTHGFYNAIDILFM